MEPLSTGKTTIPKSVNDIKLIHAGRFLENSETLADSQMTFRNLPGEVNTMHVVVQPTIAKKKTGLSTSYLLKLVRGSNIFMCKLLVIALGATI